MNFLTSKRVVTGVVVFLVLLNITLLGFLWRQNSYMRHSSVPSERQFHRQNPFTRPLGLSNLQSATFQQLRREHFRNVQPDMAAIGLLKKQLVEEAMKSQLDSQKIAALSGSIGSRQAAIERELALHFHELYKVCRPEQRDSLKKVLDQIATRRFAERRDRGGFHHPVDRGDRGQCQPTGIDSAPQKQP
ncbi:MAG: periplasmic heavy metal sensor [Chlorobiaceae bacterium]|nr:periplasmic heavy metal sensor [Chlorobiaceae bacterium]